MQNLAKKKTTFSQDIPLMVIFSAEFCDEFRGVHAQSCKKQNDFLQDIPFISISFIITSKCKILQKRKRLFREIFHLLVHVSLLILVNVESCKKENDFFARYSIY